ncbi:MAG: hypothetical protein LBS44_00250 [Deltaproteobacteria bacterium]|jgi:Tfp pilus assembly protein PilV|nr:hypothetical protein [Deltaproteobacteria bacterium]
MKPTSQSGMTLIELFITIFILTVGCMAAFKMLITSNTGNAMASQINVASVLAESEVERIKSLSRSQLDKESALGPKVEESLDRFGLPCSTGSCQGQEYKRTVRYYPESVTTLTTGIEVEISWRSLSSQRNLIRSASVTYYTF